MNKKQLTIARKGANMRTLTFILLCVFLTGCATTDIIRANNRTKLLNLSIGMTKQEALNIMGTKTEVDYEHSITINNPYRSEILRGKDKTFEILYYYTDMKRADNAITDDELTPLVFDDGKLIGWGWAFLEQNINKYEIRVR